MLTKQNDAENLFRNDDAHNRSKAQLKNINSVQKANHSYTVTSNQLMGGCLL